MYLVRSIGGLIQVPRTKNQGSLVQETSFRLRYVNSLSVLLKVFDVHRATYGPANATKNRKSGIKILLKGIVELLNPQKPFHIRFRST